MPAGELNMRFRRGHGRRWPRFFSKSKLGEEDDAGDAPLTALVGKSPRSCPQIIPGLHPLLVKLTRWSWLRVRVSVLDGFPPPRVSRKVAYPMRCASEPLPRAPRESGRSSSPSTWPSAPPQSSTCARPCSSARCFFASASSVAVSQGLSRDTSAGSSSLAA